MTLWIPLWKLGGFVTYVVLYLVTCQAHFRYPDETYRSAFFKALPIVQLIFMTATTNSKDPDFNRYRKAITWGLVASAIGDICLVWRHQLFLHGLVAFAIAQVFYLCAFGFKPPGTGPTAMSCAILAAGTAYVILPAIKEGTHIQGLVLIYILLIFSMAWRALVRRQRQPTFMNLCACLGAASFVTSDFVIAYDKWCHPVQRAPQIIIATYLFAQLGIGLSASCEITKIKRK